MLIYNVQPRPLELIVLFSMCISRMVLATTDENKAKTLYRNKGGCVVYQETEWQEKRGSSFGVSSWRIFFSPLITPIHIEFTFNML